MRYLLILIALLSVGCVDKALTSKVNLLEKDVKESFENLKTFHEIQEIRLEALEDERTVDDKEFEAIKDEGVSESQVTGDLKIKLSQLEEENKALKADLTTTEDLLKATDNQVSSYAQSLIVQDKENRTFQEKITALETLTLSLQEELKAVRNTVKKTFATPASNKGQIDDVPSFIKKWYRPGQAFVGVEGMSIDYHLRQHLVTEQQISVLTNREKFQLHTAIHNAIEAKQYPDIDESTKAFERAAKPVKKVAEAFFVGATWCVACPAEKKHKNEVVEQLGVEVETVDIHSGRGKPLAKKYKVSTVPAWVIVFDDGTWRRYTGGGSWRSVKP